MLALYAGALRAPVFLFDDPYSPVLGWRVLFWGWWGFLFFIPAWLANWLEPVALFFLVRGDVRWARRFAAAALGVGLTSFFARKWYFGGSWGEPIRGYGPGFWLWLSSLAVGLAGALAGRARPRPSA